VLNRNSVDYQATVKTLRNSKSIAVQKVALSLEIAALSIEGASEVFKAMVSDPLLGAFKAKVVEALYEEKIKLLREELDEIEKEEKTRPGNVP